MAFLPASLKGFPIFSVMSFKNVSKSIHSPLSLAAVASSASQINLYLRSNPRVLAVLRMSATSTWRWLSQYKLNISKKSSHCSRVKTGFRVTISRANTAFLSFSASSFRLYNMFNFQRIAEHQTLLIQLIFNLQMRLSLTLLVALLVTSTLSQQCLNQAGVAVDWYTMLILPNSVSTGYLYFDSTFTTSSFVYHAEEPDAPKTPSYNTFNQINTLAPQYLAWNDELPNGTTSSTKAHSKAVIAYNAATYTGFAIIHSMPQYPAFNGNTVNITIGSSQSIYGQHLTCIFMNSAMTREVLAKTSIMKPYYYASNLATAPTFKTANLFEYSTYQYKGQSVQFIYKNGALNGSIFEDGLNAMLNSRIVAETWGRPIDPPWCGTPSTGNANTINFTKTINWGQMADHSKWAYAMDNDFSCFGDMNRMSSQWKRGGAFYCISSHLLATAIKAIVPAPVTC